MENKSSKRNTKRTNLIIFAILLFIYLVIFISIVALVKQEINTSYDGNTKTIDGVVSKVSLSDEHFVLLLEGNNTEYTTSAVSTQYNWEALLGKQVQLILPQNDTNSKSDKILGLIIDGKIEIDAEQTIESKIAENREIVNVMIALICVSAVAVCVLIVCAINSKPKEISLAREIAELNAYRQPSYPKLTKTLAIFALFLTLLIAVTFIFMIISGEQVENKDEIKLVFALILLTISISGLIAMLIMLNKLRKKTIEFYEVNYPFDFNNVSHMHLPKKTKERILEEIQRMALLYPHTYSDFGNYFQVQFTEDSVLVFDIDEFEEYDDHHSRENIFDSEDRPQPIMQFTYNKLNFEAIPFTRIAPLKPIVVVIKSRLEHTDDFPEEFINDLHFVLDSNLLETLRHFDVTVEKLDNTLQNLHQLMTEKPTENK